MYYWQLEQQLLVGGLEKIIFVCSDGTRDNFASMEYRPVPGRAKQLAAGWQQFARDLADYKPAEVVPAAVAAPQASLPAVVVRMDGALTVASNLPDFAVALRAYIDRIPANPSTDQEFADCEAACKALKNAEDALENAENAALAQMTDVEQMRRIVGDLRNLARATRLEREKMVKARKESIRVEIMQEGVTAYRVHYDALNKRIGKPYMPVLPIDFAGVIKGKKTVLSLRDAVSTELARAKIAANEVADRIQVNLATLAELAGAHKALFPDTAAIVLKASDDLTALVKTRIADHEKAEAERLEKQRARIAEEERVKAEAKVRAEAAETARQEAATQARIAAQARAKAEADAKVAAAAIAPPGTFTPPAPYVRAVESVTDLELLPSASNDDEPSDMEIIECCAVALMQRYGWNRLKARERIEAIEWDLSDA